MDSLRSASWVSTTESIRSLMPPLKAHNYGYPRANFLTVSTAIFLSGSSAYSANATKLFASNLGKVFGEISIHFIIYLRA